MALKNCPECDGKVSSKAEICPHCGFKIKGGEPSAKEKGIGCLVLLGITVLCFFLCSGWMNSSIEKSNQEEEARRSALTPAERDEEDRLEKLKSQFSPWDGSHRDLVQKVKDHMNDPNSFEHAETLYWDQKKTVRVQMKYRGKNAFGGVVTNSVIAIYDLDGNLQSIEFQE